MSKQPVVPGARSPSYIPRWVPERGRLYAKGWEGNDNPQDVITTTDGYKWEKLTDSAPPGEFVYSPELDVFVTARWKGKVVGRSSDCVHWETRSISYNWSIDERYGSLIWVADFGIFVGGVKEGVIVSTDGLNWTLTSMHGSPYDDPYPGIGAVGYGGGRFVACSGSGEFYTSTDGYDWSYLFNWVDDPEDEEPGRDVLPVSGITWSPTAGFIASFFGTFAISADGLTWNVYSNGVVDNPIWVPELGLFVSTELGAGVSPDGYNWWTYNNELDEPDKVQWFPPLAVAWFPPLDCLLSPMPYGDDSSRVAISSNGLKYDFLYYVGFYLRMNQRTDIHGVTRHPRALGTGRGSASAADTSGAPRVGQSNRYR